MSEPSLFTSMQPDESRPLAVRMRPASLDEVVGQQHVVGAGTPLGRMLRSSGEFARTSMVLWGPPGSGKTTLPSLVATVTGDTFVELSAITSGVKDVRDVIARARTEREMSGTHTVLFIDEVHRFSKSQQDALLPAVENGWVTLVAATTENPSFSVIAPLLSRSLVVPLGALSDDDVRQVLLRSLDDERGFAGALQVSQSALDYLVRLAGGDVRHGLTVLEAAAQGLESGRSLELSDVEQAASSAAPRYDKSGDQHYDVTSALIKSIRGSDVDAAMHYLARMVVAGEDPRFIARRLVILASEDIGMADPTALTTAVNAMHAVSFIGMPEARITLAQAVVHLSLAPKSNRSYLAINEAISDVEAGRIGTVPAPLRDASTKSARDTGAGRGYRYPHDDPAGIVPASYLPDELEGKQYYEPSEHGVESRLSEVLEKIRSTLGQAAGTDVQS